MQTTLAFIVLGLGSTMLSIWTFNRCYLIGGGKTDKPESIAVDFCFGIGVVLVTAGFKALFSI